MKECERISGFYGELHDQQLSAHLQKETLEHFRTCTECREDFKWYSITVQALNNLEELSPPGDFVSQLSAKLYATPAPRFYASYLDYLRSFLSSTPHLPLPVGAATLAFLVAVGIVVYNHTPLPLDHYAQQTQMHAVKTPAAAPSTVMTVSDGPGIEEPGFRLSPPYTEPSETSLSSPPTTRHFQAAIPKGLGPGVQFASTPMDSTLADRIGGDNLTVESPSVDNAVESIKKILPSISGMLVEEMKPGKFGEKVIGIRIPSSSYGPLTTELINHGEVAAGVGTDVTAPAPTRTDSNNLILYIRFVRSR